MQFSEADKGTQPPRIVTLPPSCFADDWSGKFRGGEVAVGLRLISQADLDTARKEAEREATGFYDQLRGSALRDPSLDVMVEIRNDALMLWAVSAAATNPNDRTKPYFLLGQEDVRRALTPQGVRRLWDEIVVMHLETGVARPVAEDADVRKLGRILVLAPKLDEEARKLVAHLLDGLEGAPEARVDSGEDDEDEDESSAYVAQGAAHPAE